MGTFKILESIRESIRAESISYDEILTLQSLYKEIPLDDVDLLEWAGVNEEDSNLVWDIYKCLIDYVNINGDIEYKHLVHLAWHIKEKGINCKEQSHA